MDLYLEAQRNTGLRLPRRWWDHPALDILVIRAGHASEEGEGGGGRIQLHKNKRERESRIG